MRLRQVVGSRNRQDSCAKEIFLNEAKAEGHSRVIFPDSLSKVESESVRNGEDSFAKEPFVDKTVCVFFAKDTHLSTRDMRWLRLVGSLKLQVSFAKEPNERDYILQKRPIILRSLLLEATPYPVSFPKEPFVVEAYVCLFKSVWLFSKRELIDYGGNSSLVAACCRAMRCVAVCRSVLQRVAVRGSVLQCVAVCCSVLQCVAACCSVWQCVAVCCSAWQRVSVCCSVLQCLQCVAVCCSGWLFAKRETNSTANSSCAAQRVIFGCTVLYCVAVCCSVMQSVVFCQKKHHK